VSSGSSSQDLEMLACPAVIWFTDNFLPAFVRLSFALLSSCSSCGHINQNAALFSNFTMLSAYCTILLQPCPPALPGSLTRQPCRNIASFLTAGGRHAAFHTFAGILVPSFRQIQHFEPCVQIECTKCTNAGKDRSDFQSCFL
jgi:hypothetical protein